MESPVVSHFGEGEQKPRPGSERPGRIQAKLLFVLGMAAEGLLLVGTLVVGGLVIFSLVRTNQQKASQLAALIVERDRLSTERDDLSSRLADTSSQLKSASDLAAQNGARAAQLDQQAKDLQTKLSQSSQDLDDLKAQNAAASKTYSELAGKFEGYRGEIECEGKGLDSPDFSSSSTIAKSLEAYVKSIDGPLQSSEKYKLYNNVLTSVYDIVGREYFYVFIVTFASDDGHRDTVYDVSRGCFLESGIRDGD